MRHYLHVLVTKKPSYQDGSECYNLFKGPHACKSNILATSPQNLKTPSCVLGCTSMKPTALLYFVSGWMPNLNREGRSGPTRLGLEHSVAA